MGFLRRLFGGAAPPPQPQRIAAKAIIVQPDRDAWLDVHGESFRQDALDGLAGPKTPDGPRRPSGHTAIFIAEPTNPQDRNAIAIQIDALHVGYLPRTQARRWLPVLAIASKHGMVLACDAVITGGWDRGGGDEGHYGVMLRIGTPAETIIELRDGGFE